MSSFIQINKAPTCIQPVMNLADSDKNGRLDTKEEKDNAKDLGKKLLCAKKHQELLTHMETHGRYDIEVKADQINNMDIMVWYPKSINSGESFPAIILSPGIGDCPKGLQDYAEQIASAGYIVVSPEHAGAKFCHVREESEIETRDFLKAMIESKFDFASTVSYVLPETLEMTLNGISYRTRETSLTIDTVIAWNSDPSSLFYNSIKPEIGIAGQSLGAWDAAHVGGVSMHCENVPAQSCEEFPTDFSVEELIPYTCCDPALFGQTTDSTHPDVKAVLLLNPGMIYFPNYLGFMEEYLKDTPFMILAENLYPKIGMETNGILPYNNLASDNKYLFEITSNHLTINNSFDFVMKYLRMGPFANAFHECSKNKYYELSIAFFDAKLKNDPRRLNAILNDPYDPLIKNKIWQENN